MDIAQLAGADYCDVELAGKTYRVGELTLGDWARVQAWIKATVPGPLSVLGTKDFADLPPGTKRQVLAEATTQARTSWPPRIGTAEWFTALDFEGGHAALLLACLAKHQPGITEADCSAIVAGPSFDPAAMMSVIGPALGLFGPKSPTPAPTPEVATPGVTAATTSGTSPISSPTPGDGPAPTS